MIQDEVIRLTSAGSVDDGKSTLLARILLDSGALQEDQLPAKIDAHRLGDLLDGLESEREQGITIDVAHRYFNVGSRRYHFADSPGHEQYTRNMATACAGSDALLLVVEAKSGLKPQTMRHLSIALRMGVPHVIFAVNKMDSVLYSKKAFADIQSEIEDSLGNLLELNPKVTHDILPVSGLTGANVVHGSKRLSWFQGNTLLEAIQKLARQPKSTGKTALTVQDIQRIAGGGRRYLGFLHEGALATNDRLFLGSQELTVTDLLVGGVADVQAVAGEPVSITLKEEVDIERGSVLMSEAHRRDREFQCELIWLADSPAARGRSYWLNSHSGNTLATLSQIRKVDAATNVGGGTSSTLESNEIGVVKISLKEPLSLFSSSDIPSLGRFTLIDSGNSQTVGVGLVKFALRRSQNVIPPSLEVGAAEHASLMSTSPKVIWLTGLSGSGKSTIADSLSKLLQGLSLPHYVIDGDLVRLGLNKDLGFSEADRAENIRRVAEVAKMMCDAGLIVIVAMVSPYESDREQAKDVVGGNRFHLVHVSTELEICITRDPKGLYRKALAGEIPNFTGISSPYQTPEHPSLVIEGQNPEDAAEIIFKNFLAIKS